VFSEKIDRKEDPGYTHGRHRGHLEKILNRVKIQERIYR
jgi:hypothetical protein